MGRFVSISLQDAQRQASHAAVIMCLIMKAYLANKAKVFQRRIDPVL
jgi:hypothetical protein